MTNEFYNRIWKDRYKSYEKFKRHYEYFFTINGDERKIEFDNDLIKHSYKEIINEMKDQYPIFQDIDIDFKFVTVYCKYQDIPY